MSIASRENLIRAMVTGRKPAAGHPGAQDARTAPALALPLAVLAVAAAAFAATRIDAQAFVPHARTEAGETRHGDGMREAHEADEPARAPHP
jgi:hypothetical protein